MRFARIALGLTAGALVTLAPGAQAAAYKVISGDEGMCPAVAAWANGKVSEVRPVAWSGAARKHVAASDRSFAYSEVGADAKRYDTIFVRTRRSDYDYRDTLISVLAADGGRICFVSGAINGNLHCQDELHEQLPDNCMACDADYSWQAQWRLTSDLLVWRSGVYAVDCIVNGPYLVVWDSPPGFRLADESVPPEPSARCVLKR